MCTRAISIYFLVFVLLKRPVSEFAFPNLNNVLHFEKFLDFCKNDNGLAKVCKGHTGKTRGGTF